MTTRNGQRGTLYAVLAVTMFSISPVFVRWASWWSPYVVTCLRMLIGSGTVFAASLVWPQTLTAEEQRISRGDWPRFALWGLVAALHFGCYIASLDYTSVAHSLALVYTSPVWVSLFSWLVLKEPLAGRKWVGILVTLAGMGVLSGFEPAWTPRMPWCPCRG